MMVSKEKPSLLGRKEFEWTDVTDLKIQGVELPSPRFHVLAEAGPPSKAEWGSNDSAVHSLV